MPTRVLQIDDTNAQMSAGGGSSLSLKLVEPPHSTQTEYACLSHCWGKLGPVKTTKASKLQFLQCVPWDVLPRSFQEAISFAHMLNIRYLWIDSLCIIQDDPDDVEREIRQMCRIYEGAVVTLAITKSHIPSEGCFSTLSPESAGYEMPVPATFDWSAAVVREVFDHAHAVSSYENPPPGKAPLLSRGWVLQERILSRRVLHFTAEELAFECVTARCCECERDPHEMPGFKSTMSQAVETDDRDGLYLKWRALVERYTNLDLTFETDRLPAIAGLAEKFERRLNDRYFYGTWAGNLLESLNWLSFIPIRRDRRPAAPSWSWAAASSTDDNDDDDDDDVVGDDDDDDDDDDNVCGDADANANDADDNVGGDADANANDGDDDDDKDDDDDGDDWGGCPRSLDYDGYSGNLGRRGVGGRGHRNITMRGSGRSRLNFTMMTIWTHAICLWQNKRGWLVQAAVVIEASARTTCALAEDPRAAPVKPTVPQPTMPTLDEDACQPRRRHPESVSRMETIGTALQAYLS
ncbi:heterokaryon incompatibility protein-domain-containing protein [Phialemonium atrogriseum]|uniref:Heterokaryon incompatibility protein-domain-containing protein n=1 Tax=Phialemonium atrogriseum TaxID=1093897 RepID=A0AAJ0C590_9PEZI|nr:heterokaryon incompatibility protein-domain-containing protein [Phialemonium atrogriseum]KAK1770191.1 heterokaryon incompatibility protein-domain-containing protein [Phialemonium atrogriseum]